MKTVRAIFRFSPRITVRVRSCTCAQLNADEASVVTEVTNRPNDVRANRCAIPEVCLYQHQHLFLLIASGSDKVVLQAMQDHMPSPSVIFAAPASTAASNVSLARCLYRIVD